ncbi:hypothetical protein WISP_101727 [Willisornis vidua]|uniref:DUF1977 domain-containing protein n=1 Tax=Willisornis vidua TaxID=1566151 RepID=A0ABQ9CYI6_9PASS|nr:hypothetical protein WISP_101727 [Willisornis vidua]
MLLRSLRLLLWLCLLLPGSTASSNSSTEAVTGQAQPTTPSPDVRNNHTSEPVVKSPTPTNPSPTSVAQTTTAKPSPTSPTLPVLTVQDDKSGENRSTAAPSPPPRGTSESVTPTLNSSDHLPTPTPTDDKSPLTVAAFGVISFIVILVVVVIVLVSVVSLRFKCNRSKEEDKQKPGSSMVSESDLKPLRQNMPEQRTVPWGIIIPKVIQSALALNVYPKPQAIGNAFAVLSNPEKRLRYDELGSDQEHVSAGQARHYNCYTEFEADITPEEIFNVFFGGHFPTGNIHMFSNVARDAHYYPRRHRPERAWTREQEEEDNRPQNSYSAFIQLMPVFIIIAVSVITQLMATNPPYSLFYKSSIGHVISRETENLQVPYYVDKNFEKNYQGAELQELEKTVEKDYIDYIQTSCWKEKQQNLELRRAKPQRKDRVCEFERPVREGEMIQHGMPRACQALGVERLC